jgi:hypothetical protein
MADFDSSNRSEYKPSIENPNESPIKGNDSDEVTVKSRPNVFGWKIGALVLIGIIALIYSSIDVNTENTKPVENIVAPIKFDPRLLACNKVSNAEFNEDFTTCLSAAEDGKVAAIKRIVWGYSRSGEFQDWKEVFSWLKKLPIKNENTQLLMYAIIHFMASSDKLKEDSEAGISRLVAKNHPPANVILAAIYALNDNVLPPTSNPRWLLERTSNEQSNVITHAQLAMVYANGFVGNIDIEKGADYLKNAAQQGFPLDTNNIAWFLSTLDNNPFTTPEYALSLAKRVTDDPAHAKNPIYVDTLAASFAANGMFNDAIETQERAMQLLLESEFNERFMQRRQTEFESRLALYKNGEALVEETIEVDKKAFFRKLKSRTVDYLFRDFYVISEGPAPLIEDDLDSGEDAETKETDQGS